MSLNDEAAFYEIVELESGEVALRRADEADSAPLVTIKFSEESSYYLDQARFDIAKIMIEAGLDAVAEMNDESDSDESATDLDDIVGDSNLIH